MTQVVKYGYNNTLSDITVSGQVIAAGQYYQLQGGEDLRWVSSDTTLSLITSGNLVISTLAGAGGHLSPSDGINLLYGNAHTDSDGYQKIRLRSFADTDGMRFRGTGISGTATKNSTTNHDYNLPEDRFLNGVELLLCDHEFGDTVKFQVVDVDGVVYPAGTVLDEFATDWNIASDTQRQGPYILPYPALIYSWMYIRVVYNSTGTVNDVKFKANLFLHRKPT